MTIIDSTSLATLRDKYRLALLSVLIVISIQQQGHAQTPLYHMPEETELHEGTWLQWPHNNLYGPWYRADVSPTFVAMTDALQTGERVHIIANDSSELAFIQNALNNASVPLNNVDFHIQATDDVWIRDNGPMFVYDQNQALKIIDWGFNGWGFDTPYNLCDDIPGFVSSELGVPVIDVNGVVLEGGAIEHDGNGTMFATRSSVTHSSRNPSLTEAQIEDSLTKYVGITNFIWLDGVYGQDITDQHIDGFVKFANDSTIVTMDSLDLDYWYVSPTEITTIYNATNSSGATYNIVTVPLTQNNVITAYGQNLGYKGSYVNYYIGNDVVLVPTYNDPNDAIAISIIQGLYSSRTVVGIDVRNIYEYGGMVHCLTQQQPVDLLLSASKPILPIIPSELSNSPNPFSETTTISYSGHISGDVKLVVRDGMGKIIKQMHVSDINGTIQFSADKLSNGIYYYSIETNNGILSSNKMIIHR